MTLHIFNPEHELVLASNLANFTAPHNVRALKSGLGFLPALWADDGDMVLVEDRDYAYKAFKKASVQAEKPFNKVLFIEPSALSAVCFSRIAPWGWDTALCNFLLRHGVDKKLMPELATLDKIRMLSHRALSKELLDSLLTINGTVGKAYACSSLQNITECVNRLGSVVLKAPWSCSGRGVRFVDGNLNVPQLQGWIKNMLNAQGMLMVEPYFKKVKDFGMEFFSDGKGAVSYKGLSLFDTQNGTYTGNIIATERAKCKIISHYISVDLLQEIKEKICSVLSVKFNGCYKGPFGVDMMIVPCAGKEAFLVHPCVEVNLRRTMGHVALSLSPQDDDLKKVMRITAEDNYQLKIKPL
jgi:hypothetical protein